MEMSHAGRLKRRSLEQEFVRLKVKSRSIFGKIFYYYFLHFIIFVKNKDAIRKKYQIPTDQMSSVWRRVMRSVNSMSRALVQTNARTDRFIEVLGRIDRVIQQARANEIDAALGTLVAIREDLANFQTRPRSETESDSESN